MHYDPIKKFLGGVFGRHPLLNRLFFVLLDVLLLRTWHVHRELQIFFRKRKGRSPIMVLDAGSGFGQYSWYISRRFKQADVFGIDIKEEEIDNCTRLFSYYGIPNARFGIEDLTTFSHPGSYDLILSVDVMEHIEDDLGVFKNFALSLKPGGKLLISTPSDKGGSDVHHEQDNSFIGEHVRDGYSIKDISDKLTAAGFTNIRARYTYGRPGSLAWKASMKLPVKMLAYTKLSLLVLPFYYLLTMPFVLLLHFADVRMTHHSGTGLLVSAEKPA